MTTPAAHTPDPTHTHWRVSSPHVRKMLAYVKKRKQVTVDELVEYDRTHGRRVFNWDDESAAADWRRQQARMFLNRFRATFDGMRVRAFIHIDKDEEADIEQSAYVAVDTIAEHLGMRAQVVADLERRMTVIAGELRMWRLTPAEQHALFARLSDAMLDEPATERATRRQDVGEARA